MRSARAKRQPVRTRRLRGDPPNVRDSPVVGRRHGSAPSAVGSWRGQRPDGQLAISPGGQVEKLMAEVPQVRCSPLPNQPSRRSSVMGQSPMMLSTRPVRLNQASRFHRVFRAVRRGVPRSRPIHRVVRRGGPSVWWRPASVVPRACRSRWDCGCGHWLGSRELISVDEGRCRVRSSQRLRGASPASAGSLTNGRPGAGAKRWPADWSLHRAARGLLSWRRRCEQRDCGVAAAATGLHRRVSCGLGCVRQSTSLRRTTRAGRFSRIRPVRFARGNADA